MLGQTGGGLQLGATGLGGGGGLKLGTSLGQQQGGACVDVYTSTVFKFYS